MPIDPEWLKPAELEQLANLYEQMGHASLKAAEDVRAGKHPSRELGRLGEQMAAFAAEVLKDSGNEDRIDTYLADLSVALRGE